MQRTESPWALGGMCNHLESIPRRTARVCLEPHLVALAGIRHPPEPRLAQLTDQFIRRTISRTGFLSRKCIRRVALRYALNPITTAISRVHDSAIYSAETGGAALHSYEIDIQPCRNGRALVFNCVS